MMISQTAVLNSHRLDVGSTLNSKTVSHNARGATSRVDATASHVVVCHSSRGTSAPRASAALKARLRHSCGPTPGRQTRNARQAEANRAERCMVYVADNENHRNRTLKMQRAFRRSLRCASQASTLCVACCELYAAQWHGAQWHGAAYRSKIMTEYDEQNRTSVQNKNSARKSDCPQASAAQPSRAEPSHAVCSAAGSAGELPHQQYRTVGGRTD